MKKTIIRLTEADLHNMIKETAQRIIKEWDEDEWDEYDDGYDFSFNNITIYYNPESQECVTDEGEITDGMWYECECSVSDYDIENDGIGSYEYWGTPGYDAGTDYPVPTDVDVDVVAAYQVSEENGMEEINDTPQLEEYDIKCIKEYALDSDMFEVQ